MLEPIVQDYINAFINLNQEDFYKQFKAPVLVSVIAESGMSFQSSPTRMLSDKEQLNPTSHRARLNLNASVLELLPIGPKSENKVTIGRSENNDLVLQDETISSQHAVFRFEPDTQKATLQDLESTNGTKIDDSLAIPWRLTPLSNGQIISFGDAVFLFYTKTGLYKMLSELISQDQPK